jgi:hypothetical protein
VPAARGHRGSEAERVDRVAEHHHRRVLLLDQRLERPLRDVWLEVLVWRGDSEHGIDALHR